MKATEAYDAERYANIHYVEESGRFELVVSDGDEIAVLYLSKGEVKDFISELFQEVNKA